MAALVLITASAPILPAGAHQPSPRTETPPTAVAGAAGLDHRVGIVELRKWHAERASRAARPAAVVESAAVAPASTKPKPQRAAQPAAATPRPRVPAAPAPVTVPAADGSRAATVVAFAMAQRGKPYVWAAAGPNSYDCSGLALAAYAQVGIRIPHQTGGIVGYGRQVSRSSLQPGDLVFTSAGHVGIYIGGGQMVHAPQSGDVVKVSAIWSFWTARRLL